MTNFEMKIAQTYNQGIAKSGADGFYDTFVLIRNLVLQINSSAEHPAIANRYVPLRCYSSVGTQLRRDLAKPQQKGVCGAS
jgi:hypothetical protein